jgi:2-methylcitrate dehydratase PrpD
MERSRDTDIAAASSSVRLTRRDLLQRASWLIAAAACPGLPKLAAQLPSPAPAGPAISPVMTTLSSYMSEARGRVLPDEVVEKAKLHILDTLAAMISGSELPPGRAAIQFARSYGGERIATIAGSNILCGPIEAALTNGMLAHSDETDDSHAASLSHPGCAIVPAALAAGERFGIDGTQFVRAVTLGYDVGPRVTMALGATDLLLQGHRATHSIAGLFGSAGAAGSAASLTAQQMRWMLDYAAQESSGIAAWQRDTEHIEKAFVFGGMPARGGVTAALVVQSGWTGVNDILSGADNFLLANSAKADPAGLVEKLGERYEVTQTNIKKWSVGSPIQAPLDALENLLKQRPFEADQVQQVIVRIATYEAAAVNNRDIPDICLQHMVAVMLIDKTVTFHSVHDKARMQDPAVLRQRAKVQLIPDEELQKLLPQREAIVEVVLMDGAHLSERIKAVRGTVDNPMTRDEVVAKARDLMAPVLGTGTCAKLIDNVLTIENTKDIRYLRPLIQRT